MANTSRIVISLTGHRPEELGGYNYHHPVNLAIATKIRKRLLHHLEQGKSIHAISGMALGADQIFALVALKLKREGYAITLEAAIPCANQSGEWPEESQKMWQDIVEQADVVTHVSTEEYTPQLMHKRNMYLVNKCHEIIAVFSGKRGGTGNTIRYAKQRNKPVFLIDPRGLVIPVKGNLLTSNSDVMFHQANCFSTMGSGIARQIKSMYPQVYEADRNAPLTPEAKFGHFTWAPIITPAGKSATMVNLYGQYRYGLDKQHTDYDKLYQAIQLCLDSLLELHNGSISHLKFGVPKNMGCGRGGGEWSVVLDMLEELAEIYRIHIYTYTL